MAIIVSNERNLFTVENSNESVTLHGEVTVNEMNQFGFISGSFTDTDTGAMIGMYNLSEMSDRKSKSITDVPLNKFDSAESLLLATVIEIKQLKF